MRHPKHEQKRGIVRNGIFRADGKKFKRLGEQNEFVKIDNV